MAWKTRLTLFWLFAGLVGWPHEGLAARGEAVENTQNLCLSAARAQEQASGIPRNLLAAIAMSESGRYDKDSGESFAWPWTVTAEGKGRYFATKAEARAEVEILLSQGVKNIDVGCMQVNLYYHWDAFETLDKAFDPATNAAYAAKFLKANYANTKDWLDAAGHYHSQTPENFRGYRIKVLSFWNRLKRDEAETRLAAKDKDKGKQGQDAGDDEDKEREVRIVSVDYAATDRFNRILKEKRQAARLDMRQLDAGARRLAQLDDWRSTKHRAQRLEAVVAQRMAEMELRRKEYLRQFDDHSHDRGESFADRRQEQLERWRNTGNLVGDAVSGVK